MATAASSPDVFRAFSLDKSHIKIHTRSNLCLTTSISPFLQRPPPFLSLSPRHLYCICHARLISKREPKNLPGEFLGDRKGIKSIGLRDLHADLVLVTGSPPDEVNRPTSEPKRKSSNVDVEPKAAVVKKAQDSYKKKKKKRTNPSMQRKAAAAKKKDRQMFLRLVSLHVKRPPDVMVSNISEVVGWPRKRVLNWFKGHQKD